MNTIKRYMINWSFQKLESFPDSDTSDCGDGLICKDSDVEGLEKENDEFRKYKKMWNELKDEVEWIADEMVYNSMIEKEKELKI